jgi:hypothetical protein
LKLMGGDSFKLLFFVDGHRTKIIDFGINIFAN